MTTNSMAGTIRKPKFRPKCFEYSNFQFNIQIQTLILLVSSCYADGNQNNSEENSFIQVNFCGYRLCKYRLSGKNEKNVKQFFINNRLHFIFADNPLKDAKVKTSLILIKLVASLIYASLDDKIYSYFILYAPQ